MNQAEIAVVEAKAFDHHADGRKFPRIGNRGAVLTRHGPVVDPLEGCEKRFLSRGVEQSNGAFKTGATKSGVPGSILVAGGPNSHLIETRAEQQQAAHVQRKTPQAAS